MKQTLIKKSTFRNRNFTISGDKLEGPFKIIQYENIPEISRRKKGTEAVGAKRLQRPEQFPSAAF